MVSVQGRNWSQVLLLAKTTNRTDTIFPTETFAYDALGRRVQESTPTVRNHLYYDTSGRLIEEWDAQTQHSKLYVWSASGDDTLVLRDEYQPDGLTLIQRPYVQQDANGDVTSILDGKTGAVQERFEYDPYGSVTYLDPSWNPQASSPSGWQMLHQALRLDATTGWYDNGARDLIPAEGRFAERDPLGLGGDDLNLYRYEENEPLDLTDPTGEQNAPTLPSSVHLTPFQPTPPELSAPWSKTSPAPVAVTSLSAQLSTITLG
jgi:RHS repeat-associated protein